MKVKVEAKDGQGRGPSALVTGNTKFRTKKKPKKQKTSVPGATTQIGRESCRERVYVLV